MEFHSDSKQKIVWNQQHRYYWVALWFHCSEQIIEVCSHLFNPSGECSKKWELPKSEHTEGPSLILAGIEAAWSVFLWWMGWSPTNVYVFCMGISVHGMSGKNMTFKLRGRGTMGYRHSLEYVEHSIYIMPAGNFYLNIYAPVLGTDHWWSGGGALAGNSWWVFFFLAKFIFFGNLLVIFSPRWGGQNFFSFSILHEAISKSLVVCT